MGAALGPAVTAATASSSLRGDEVGWGWGQADPEVVQAALAYVDAVDQCRDTSAAYQAQTRGDCTGNEEGEVSRRRGPNVPPVPYLFRWNL